MVSSIPAEDRAAANAALDVAIRERATRFSFGELLAEEGITTVALDSDGRLVTHYPDGSTDSA